MRAVLVGAEYEENLAIRYLAAALQEAGHEATLVPFNRAENLTEVAQACMARVPDLIGLSIAFQHRAREFLDLATRLREVGFKGHLCAGGHVPTPAWKELLECAPAVDTVVRHDGEQTLVELCHALDEPERWRLIPGVCARDERGTPRAAPPRRQVDDLDTLPFPLRDPTHPRHAGFPFTTISGSRGCFADCNYCCINTWHRSALGKRFRARSTASIAEEMALLYDVHGVRVFCFHDDNFFLPKPAQTRQRLERLREDLDTRGVGRIAFIAKCRPDEVDLPLLREARTTGLVRLYVGVENGSPQGLRNLNRRHDLPTTRRALAALRQAGVYACYNVLLFEPETRLEEVDENLRFIEEQVDFPFNFGRTEIYAGTAYERLLRDQGRLKGSFLGYTYRILDDRAEVLFRICAVAFGVRNFAEGALANQSSGLGYEAALLEHFLPAGRVDRVVAEARALTRRISLDTIAHLREAYDFVRTDAWRAPREAQRFTEDLATRVNVRNLELGAALDDLKQAIRATGHQLGGELPSALPLAPPARCEGAHHRDQGTGPAGTQEDSRDVPLP